MTITYKGEIPDLEDAENNLGIRVYARGFLLQTSDKAERAYHVGSHPSLPKIGSPHPHDPTAWCRRLRVKNHEPWTGWQVIAEYSSEFEMAENPLLEPARIRGDSELFREVAWKDRNGHAILNSAGDFFSDPAPERDRHNRIFIVTKNVANVPTWLIDSEDAINSTAFTIRGYTVPAEKAKLNRVAFSESQRRNGVEYIELTMEIALNKDGWNLQPLDAGFRAYDSVSGTMIRIHNGDGTDPTTPIPLDGTGEPLTAPSPTTAVYGDFDVYPTLDFNTLPLT